MPSEVRDAVSRLRAAAAAEVPPKLLDRNLLIATWRWPRVFRVAPQWLSQDGGSGERDLRAVHLLAEVVRHFDVIAIQGVMAHAPTVLPVMELLGPDWAFLMTGLSRESTYRERTAIVFDTRKVLPQGVLRTRPPGYVVEIEPAAVDVTRFTRLRGEGRAALAGG